MKSIIYHLESGEFARIRIGIGDPGQGEAIGHVLGRFKKEERKAAFAGIEAAALAAEIIVEEGMDPAMNRYNGNNII
jgi:PTH1 family peptidyl-tRNA hydrolase